MSDLYTEKLTLAELQRVVARLLDYLDLEVTRRPDDPAPTGLRLVVRDGSAVRGWGPSMCRRNALKDASDDGTEKEGT